MKKWIDEIAADFVNDLIKKSKQPTDMLKAQEVHDYIGSKTSEELAIEMNISSKDWNIYDAWQYAEQAAYSMVCRAFQKELGIWFKERVQSELDAYKRVLEKLKEYDCEDKAIAIVSGMIDGCENVLEGLKDDE